MARRDQRTEWRQAARQAEPDRFLAALLAPREVREDLLVLAEFLAEIGRVVRVVGEPRLAEIRLQWWIEALEAAQKGAESGHPLADALAEIIRRRRLDLAPFVAVIEARIAEIAGPESEADEATLLRHLDGREGPAFQCAADMLGVARTDARAAAIAAAGRAYGVARLAADFTVVGGEGRGMLPRRWAEADIPALAARLAPAAQAALARLREIEAADAHKLMAAILPCALVEPYLEAFERDGRSGGITPLARVWHLWRAHRRQRI